jgi:predicted deacetylase
LRYLRYRQLDSAANRMVRIHLWPFGHQGALAIRDDDSSYFTHPDMLGGIYSGIWNKAPISLAVIPRIRATGDVPLPTEFSKDGRLYPVSANEDLCEFLRDGLAEHTISISQHGYSHESFSTRPEFCLNDSAQLASRIRMGRVLLEETFGRLVRVFVPPHGRLSREASLAVMSERMSTARDCNYSQVFRSAFSACNSPELATLFLKNPLVWRHPISPRLALFKTHTEMVQSNMLASDTLRSNTLAQMKREFAKVTSADDLYYLTVHHWDFYVRHNQPNWKMLETLNAFVDFVKQSNAWITTLEGVAEWIDALGFLRVSRDGHDIRIMSSKKVNGLTISTRGSITHNGFLTEAGENEFVLNLEEGEEVKIRTDPRTNSSRS